MPVFMRLISTRRTRKVAFWLSIIAFGLLSHWRWTKSRHEFAVSRIEGRPEIWWDATVTFFGPDSWWYPDSILGKLAPKRVKSFFSATAPVDIYFVGSAIQDSDLAALANLIRIDTLTIVNPSLSKSGYNALGDNIRHLQIFDDNFDAVASNNFSRSKNLRSLSIIGSPLSQDHLLAFKNSEIQHIAVFPSAIPKKSRKKIQQSLPMKVEFLTLSGASRLQEEFVGALLCRYQSRGGDGEGTATGPQNP